MARIILHIDMDYFFAQIEERENPQFKGRPVVVGADPKGGRGRGVVSTANYEARKHGIRSALPVSKAYQLCPKAVFLPVNIELYQKVSESIMEIIKKYSQVFEQVSLDEAYLDITFLINTHNTKNKRSLIFRKGWGLAKKLKDEILEREKLTSTIGIGPNKLIAKMASEEAKPDGLLAVNLAEVQEFLEPLDIEKLPGIGPKTGEKLRAVGVNRIKELEKLSKQQLKEMFGKWGEGIYEKARGIDESPVTSEEIIKSIGKEHTFEKDTRDPEVIFDVFDKIIKAVWAQLVVPGRSSHTESRASFRGAGRGARGNEVSASNPGFRTITVVCRFQGFETHTKSKTLKTRASDLAILQKESKRLLLKFLLENKKAVRLVGLRLKLW